MVLPDLGGIEGFIAILGSSGHAKRGISDGETLDVFCSSLSWAGFGSVLQEPPSVKRVVFVGVIRYLI